MSSKWDLASRLKDLIEEYGLDEVGAAFERFVDAQKERSVTRDDPRDERPGEP